MSKKYDCWFCECGRIHIMDYEFYDWMQENFEHRCVIRICTNCGANHRVWLTESFYGGFDINGADVDLNGKRTIIDTTEFSEGFNEYKFIFDRGIKVPMKSGGYADYHFHDGYANVDYMREKLGTTYIYEALKKDPLCCTVDVERLIKEVNDDDIIKSISGYIIGIDWKGTKYEHKWK